MHIDSRPEISSARPIGAKQRQGKCVPCGIRYVWPEAARGVRVRVCDARCPKCGTKLQQTVYFSQLPVIEIEDPATLLPPPVPPAPGGVS